MAAQVSLGCKGSQAGDAASRPACGGGHRARGNCRARGAVKDAHAAQYGCPQVSSRHPQQLHTTPLSSGKASGFSGHRDGGGLAMIIGAAGHIDHGKTTLIRKLTGVDTDRLKEEKARGISIDLGFAYWPRPNGMTLAFVDVPGHEGLVHNMLAGATGIDFVILIIAADDGVMPQTREHLAIMDLLGLERGLVALNKCDLVAGERIAAVKHQIGTMLDGTGLAGCPIIPVSAATGSGLEELTEHLDRAATNPSKRSKDGLFRLAVDRSFTLQGLGTAVSGTILSGVIRVD